MGRGCRAEAYPKVKGFCQLPPALLLGGRALPSTGLAYEENAPAQAGAHLVPCCSGLPSPEAQEKQERSGVFAQARGGALKILVFRPPLAISESLPSPLSSRLAESTSSSQPPAGFPGASTSSMAWSNKRCPAKGQCWH